MAACVFSQEKVVIRDIIIEGNRITKESIIRRELELNIGDSLLFSELKEKIESSISNLKNLSIFNFVEILPEEKEDGGTVLLIKLTERWYTWPVPFFAYSQRNFNAFLDDPDPDKFVFGLFLVRNNFRGRLEELNVLAQFGYEQKFAMNYTLPYINRKKTLGMAFEFAWAGQKIVPYKLQEHKEVFYTNDEDYLARSYYGISRLRWRPDFHNSFICDLRYDHCAFADTLYALNSNFASVQGNFDYFSLTFMYKHDKRDYKHYPLEGNYFDVLLEKRGLYLLDRDHVDRWAVSSWYRHFWKIGSGFYAAAGAYGHLAGPSRWPFSDPRALGFDRTYVRTYDKYLIQGLNFALFKSNLKFEVLSPRKQKIPFIKSEKFGKIHYALYTNLFVDAGYVYDPEPACDAYLANEFLLSSGIGLDFVTYYDMVFRIEYGLNKRMENGIFINFTAPI